MSDIFPPNFNGSLTHFRVISPEDDSESFAIGKNVIIHTGIGDDIIARVISNFGETSDTHYIEFKCLYARAGELERWSNLNASADMPQIMRYWMLNWTKKYESDDIRDCYTFYDPADGDLINEDYTPDDVAVDMNGSRGISCRSPTVCISCTGGCEHGSLGGIPDDSDFVTPPPPKRRRLVFDEESTTEVEDLAL